MKRLYLGIALLFIAQSAALGQSILPTLPDANTGVWSLKPARSLGQVLGIVNSAWLMTKQNVDTCPESSAQPSVNCSMRWSASEYVGWHTQRSSVSGGQVVVLASGQAEGTNSSIPGNFLPQEGTPPAPEIFAAPTREYMGPRVWASAEYLRWWVRRGPVPPLVTTGNPTDAVPGAIGQPGTRILFGASGIDYGAFNGGRINLGRWLDAEHSIGLEGSGFLLEQRTSRFALASDSNGVPPIYLPLINQNPGSVNFKGAGSYTVADPNFPNPLAPTSGNVSVNSASRLWGAELNGLLNLARAQSWRLDAIAGFRYQDLQENLILQGASNDRFDDLQQSFRDSFNTRNQFYGGQLGTRLSVGRGRVSMDLTGKVALGETHGAVDVQGKSLFGGSGFALPPGLYSGGVYAQPSNIGHVSSNTFSVVPQVGIKIGFDVTSRLRATAGYDFIYWSGVVRPGNQIDLNVNPTQFPGATFSGLPLPASQFNRSDYLAHGFNLGVEWRY